MQEVRVQKQQRNTRSDTEAEREFLLTASGDLPPRGRRPSAVRREPGRVAVLFTSFI